MTLGVGWVCYVGIGETKSSGKMCEKKQGHATMSWFVPLKFMVWKLWLSPISWMWMMSFWKKSSSSHQQSAYPTFLQVLWYLTLQWMAFHKKNQLNLPLMVVLIYIFADVGLSLWICTQKFSHMRKIYQVMNW